MTRTHDTSTSLGLRLFRNRSLLPLLLLPLAVLAFLTTPEPTGPPLLLSIVLSATGLLARALVIGVAPNQTSGRLTKRFQARVLTDTGLYALVRHPLYAANYLVLLGPVSAVGSPWLALVYTIAFGGFYGAILRSEDAFLASRFGNAHAEWAARTPALVPRTLRWVRPELRFCPRTVLRHDYSTWLLVVTLFTALHAASVALGREDWEPGWGIAFSLSVGAAIAVKVVKYRTRWLHVRGR